MIKNATIRLCALLLLVAGLMGFAASAFAAPRDLMAINAGDEGLWVAQVQTDPDASNALQTVVSFREKSKESWNEIARMGGRVVSIAARGSQLACLQDNGEWTLIWSHGSAIGQPLPMAGQIRALANEGQSLWAVALVTGDLPTTQPTPATLPAPPTLPVLEVATTKPALPPRWMLFKLGTNGWQKAGEIAAPADSDVAMAADRGIPFTALLAADGSMDVFRNTKALDVTLSSHPIDFSIVTFEAGQMLWTAGGADGGALVSLVKSAPSGKLATPAGMPANASRAVAISTGRLRLLFTKPDKGNIQVWEQKYDTASLEPIGPPAQLPFPVPAVESTVGTVFRAMVLAAMVFTVLASFQHRRSVQELVANPDRPIPAALPQRLLAGAIDFLPMIGGYIAFFFYVPRNADVMVMMAEPSAQLITLVASASYLLHTTVIEAIFGRSIGKMIVGLKVVGLDGKPAKTGPLIVRNLLRVIELTFLPMAGLMIVSPLRQRAGDIAAGTLVVSAKEPLPPPPVE
ncbi:hypothetical protein BH10PLA1_BH10PLA1_12620 [soil metagenome]